MRRSLVDILCCPLDHHAPLELIILEGNDEEVVSGVILCKHCGRWYAIMRGIPHLVRDGLRLVEEEIEFLERFEEQLPDSAQHWKPYGAGADI